MKKVLHMTVITLLAVLISSCSPQSTSTHPVKKISISPEFQNICLLPNTMYSGDKSIKVENRVAYISIKLESAKIKGLLGGKGKAVGVAGVTVKLTPEHNSGMTVWHPKKEIPLGKNTLSSDDGGLIRFRIKSGHKLGDNYLKIETVNKDKGHLEISTTLRIINGVRILGSKQTGGTGEVLDNPLGIMLRNAGGKPITGAKVRFRIIDTPENLISKRKAKLTSNCVTSDARGIAETNFTLGKKSGTYKLILEVVHPDIRPLAIDIEQYGLNLTGILNGGLIVTVLGGLSIFVFGMKLMGDGLQMVAGEKMKSLLQFFAKNRIVAVCAGAMVTGVIQSSSACTVMVVGFVNAGLLNLTQAIGIIFGANIGTTITAQMIAFKLSNLAVPAIIIGLVVMLVSKRSTLKGWGQTLLGFGLLFYGMSIMSEQLKAIATFPQFITFFQTFDCTPKIFGEMMPIGAICGAITIGALITVIIQSSSAAMGIVLALTTSGLISFYTAVPLILGTNIGTTITAVLASIGTNERAKQAAAAHVMFNLLGSGLMIVLFFIPCDGAPIFLTLINNITPGNALDITSPENVMRHTAMAHTFFNVVTVIMFIPLIGVFARICETLIKVKDGVKISVLEPHLLNTPSIALQQTIQSIRYMTTEAWSMIQESVEDAFVKARLHEPLLDDLTKREERVDKLQEEIAEYLVQLTKRKLTHSQLQLIPSLMHCNNDAESIADHAETIIGLAKRFNKPDVEFSDAAMDEFLGIWKVLTSQAQNVIVALDNQDKSPINFAIKEKREIYRLCADAERNHVKRLTNGHCSVIQGIIFIEMLTELERIGSKFSNIAERSTEMQQHNIVFNQNETINSKETELAT